MDRRKYIVIAAHTAHNETVEFIILHRKTGKIDDISFVFR
jgi:hypothetical protein